MAGAESIVFEKKKYFCLAEVSDEMIINSLTIVKAKEGR
jgi:hypothetical protein